MNKYLKENEMKTVLFVHLKGIANANFQSMTITTAEELSCGVPIQVLFEVVPERLVAYAVADDGIELEIAISQPSVAPPKDCTSRTYRAVINSIKARVKPGTAQFVGAEEKYLDDIINETEDAGQMEKCAQERAEKCKKLEDNANRFTGLEI